MKEDKKIKRSDFWVLREEIRILEEKLAQQKQMTRQALDLVRNLQKEKQPCSINSQ